MRILIAILSCKAHQSYQQAQRDTWLKDIPKGVDFQYFVGHSDSLYPDETTLGQDAIHPDRGLKLYPTLPAKVKALCGLTIQKNYDMLFKTDTDTLVNVPNLLASGFERYDYYGAWNSEETGEFASGGAGYWLSRKAMQTIVDSTITSWAEDVFVALALKEKGILPVWNSGFRWSPGEVVDKDMITLHLPSARREKVYDPQWMYEEYRKMKEVQCS